MLAGRNTESKCMFGSEPCQVSSVGVSTTSGASLKFSGITADNTARHQCSGIKFVLLTTVFYLECSVMLS